VKNFMLLKMPVRISRHSDANLLPLPCLFSTRSRFPHTPLFNLLVARDESDGDVGETTMPNHRGRASKQFVACAYPSMMPLNPVDVLQWWCVRGS
jgi:hypothetical protein